MATIKKDNLDAIHLILRQTINKANKALLEIVEEGFEKHFKENDDPVTTGDLVVNTILQTELTEHFPSIGWLSEETRDNIERLKKEKVWVVDPIDGTKEFVQGIPEYSISVALIEKGEPIVAIISNPLKKEVYSAMKGYGAFLNDAPIHVKEVYHNKPTILASRSEIKRGEWKQFEEKANIIPTGSIAYKLALIAAGEADATFSLGPKHEWDIAAGCLLVEEAGGHVSDKYGQKFMFNQKNTLVNSIVASSLVARKHIFEMITEEVKKNG
ncbi:MAG: 3'(2'),5'-bisphosphate nucleotidase CysQ [Candidatus Heimdallarchaeaceae archaeon]